MPSEGDFSQYWAFWANPDYNFQKEFFLILWQKNYLSVSLALWANFSLRAEDLKIRHFTDPVFWTLHGNSLRPGRGEKLSAGVYSIGGGAGLSIEGSSGSQITILGPAHFQVSEKSKTLVVDYGDVGLQGDAGSDWTWQVGPWSGAVAQSKIYFESSPDQNLFRFKNLGRTQQLASLNIKAQQIYLKESRRERILPISPEDLHYTQTRHQAHWLRQDTTTLKLAEHEAHLDPQLYGIFDIGATVDMRHSELRGGGAFLRLGRFTYVQKFPRNTERVHYLRYPAWRWGLEMNYLQSSVQYQNSVRAQMKQVALGPYFGFTWLEAFIDVHLAYIQDPDGAFQGRPPLRYQVQAGYRWDLAEWVDEELGLSLETYYGHQKMQFKKALVPKNMPLSFFGFQSALSYRF